MARNNDRTTRRWRNLQKKYDREGRSAQGREAIRDEIRDWNRTNDRNTRTFGGKAQSPERGVVAGMSGASRQKGRRGVRARRRNGRILTRMLEGTYTQPSGGTITNS